FMKNEDVENMLGNLQKPAPENILQYGELKIPLLSYKRSSRAGLWLLLLPFTFAITVVLRTILNIQSGFLELPRKLFSFIDNNAVLTYLIPIIFVGLPLASMTINALAICHFQKNHKAKELIITIKYRPFNIAIFLISFAVLVFFLLPDQLSF
ncbi:MAG TPA: hypothetical protein VHL77_10430, partial [Ferruginibacter sp.]|nr:hypothetical protein [Ferruginibacter sp.]